MKMLENISDTLMATLHRIYEKKKALDALRPLPYSALGRLKEELNVEWTYNSNSIEGNTLTLVETRIVLEQGITIGGKTLREHFEITNHREAIGYVESLVAQPDSLSEREILNIHALVLANIDKMRSGKYRDMGVRIAGAGFVPPDALQVPGLMAELIEAVRTNPENLGIVELATWFHHRFVWIHPFFDGNGRTVRLAMNLMLMQAGFPPAVILRNDRKKYYEALKQADAGRYDKLLLLVLQALERSLNIYLQAHSAGSDDHYREISNLVEEEQMPYGAEYLSLLARRGLIDAYKDGRNWLTTKRAVRDYMANRQRKRKV